MKQRARFARALTAAALAGVLGVSAARPDHGGMAQPVHGVDRYRVRARPPQAGQAAVGSAVEPAVALIGSGAGTHPACAFGMLVSRREEAPMKLDLYPESSR